MCIRDRAADPRLHRAAGSPRGTPTRSAAPPRPATAVPGSPSKSRRLRTQILAAIVVIVDESSTIDPEGLAVPVTRMNHAVLYVRQVSRTVAFYRDVLDFRVVAEMAGGCLLYTSPSP